MKIEFDLTPEQEEKVRKMLAEEKKEDKKEWINEDDDFYTLDSSIGVDFGIWKNSEGDEYCLNRANVYRTRDAVEQADRQRLALGAIHQYVRENGIRMAGFNGYVPDWKDRGEEKWQIPGWDYANGKACTCSLSTLDFSSHGLIFATVEDRQKVFDNCKKELEELLKVDYSIIR